MEEKILAEEEKIMEKVMEKNDMEEEEKMWKRR